MRKTQADPGQHAGYTEALEFREPGFRVDAAGRGTCTFGKVPVYRAYNNGSLRGVDSNHRITRNFNAIQEVLNRGWSNEGVVMCAPQ
jgi:hypothetical protein